MAEEERTDFEGEGPSEGVKESYPFPTAHLYGKDVFNLGRQTLEIRDSVKLVGKGLGS